MKRIKFVSLMVCMALAAAFVTACGPPKTLTDTISEAEFLQEDTFCKPAGLTADFQPGKLVCSGESDGQQIVAVIVAEVVDGVGRFKIISISADGKPLPLADFSEMNAGLAEDAFIPEEGYAITSIIITDNELTITRSLK